MTSRIPPSRRDPEYAPQRAARAVAQQTPGTGRVAAAAPNLSGDIAARLRGKASPGAAGDSDHVGAGTQSTQVGATANASGNVTTALGYDATASATNAVSLGAYSDATLDGAIALGYAAQGTGLASICIGVATSASAVGAIAIGGSASASAARAIAIGRSASNAVADRCVIRANDVEAVRSDGTGATSLILASPDGTRWRLSVDNAGALVIAAA